MSLDNKAKRDLRQYFSNIMYLVSGRTGTLEASCRYSGRTKTALRTTSTVMIEYGPVERKSTRDKLHFVVSAFIFTSAQTSVPRHQFLHFGWAMSESSTSTGFDDVNSEY